MRSAGRAAQAAGIPKITGTDIKYHTTQNVVLTATAQLTKITLTGGSNTGTATTDTTAPLVGGQTSHIRITGSGVNGSTYAYTPGSAWDFSNSFLRFKIRTQLYSNARKIEVRFADTSAAYVAGNYVTYLAKAKPSDSSMGNWYPPNTWIWDSIAPQSCVVVGIGVTSMASIGYIVFGFGEVSGQTCLFDLAGFQVVTNASAKAKLVIWHDDTQDSGSAAIYTKMSANSFPACEATEWEVLGIGGGALTTAEAATYKAAGWQFATHVPTAAEHVAQTEQQVQAQALRNRIGAMRNGFTTGAQDFTYWGGLASDVAYPAVVRSYRSGRWNTSLLSWADTLPPADPWLMKALLVTAATDTFAAQWQPYINAAIANKGIAQLVFHQDVFSLPACATEFDSMMTWCAANTALIDVVTLSTALATSLV